MDLKLQGKTVFITGATSGIGFATAKLFTEEGATVIINGRSEQSIQQAIVRLKAEVPEGAVTGIPADFSKTSDVIGLLKQLPFIDILINNVGIYTAESFFDTPDEDWHRQFEVNVMSGVRLSRALLPKMLDTNWGRIVFVSSECASLVPNDLIPYSTTKLAQLAIARGLAQLTKGTGVTINSVLPGSTMTEGAAQFLQNAADQQNKSKDQVITEFFEEVRTSSLIQRFISVEEIASTIVYLCSPLAVATNGAAIKVDGGSMPGII